ncbi:MAG: cellulose biosynthesis cyclic di-GMP-binding regulatory protein BcsB, partial [Pseudomonadota bacterium]
GGERTVNQRLLAGQHIRFADLGLNGEEFDGRLYRNGFDITLPGDYFSADYDSAELNLTAGYSAGLASDSRLIIRVNGTTVAGIALARRAGHLFHNKMVRLPLSNFRPGINRVEIEAQVANAADRDCHPRRQIEDNKRFLISGRSTIRLPKLARVTRLPDLGPTLSSGYPYNDNSVTLAIAQPDFDHLSAAATIATRLALSSGKPLPFDIRYGAPSADTAHAIIIGAYHQLPFSVAEQIPGIEEATIQTAWSPDLGGVDMFTTASISPARTASSLAPKVEKARKQDDDDALLERWSRIRPEATEELEEKRPGLGEQFFDLSRSLFEGKADRHAGAMPNHPIDAKHSHMVVNQRSAPVGGDGVWTILTARDGATLREGAALLSRPSIMAQLHGETVAIDTLDHTVTSTVVTQPVMVVRDWSPGNLKRLMAGWFSNHHFIFSALLLGTLISIASLSSLVLRRSGVAKGENCRHG